MKGCEFTNQITLFNQYNLPQPQRTYFNDPEIRVSHSCNDFLEYLQNIVPKMKYDASQKTDPITFSADNFPCFGAEQFYFNLES